MLSYFVDTNVFLRYLTKDVSQKYEKCRQLFEEAVNGKVKLVTTEVVLVEIMWTLLSYYKIHKEEVIATISTILNTPGLKISNQKMLAEALVLYGQKNSDFVDAYNATFAQHNHIQEVYSYDEHFGKIEYLTRKEPQITIKSVHF